jgi:CheY-like chemotaxis protein
LKPESPDKQNQSKQPSSKKKILLVDDDQLSCEVTVDMLEVIDCEVDVANDGLQALDAYTHEKYKLILMDCEMPVMDGFTAASQWRLKEKKSQSPSVPIIAITGHAIADIKEKGLASGMNGFLSKPFNMMDLHTTVKKWL